MTSKLRGHTQRRGNGGVRRRACVPLISPSFCLAGEPLDQGSKVGHGGRASLNASRKERLDADSVTGGAGSSAEDRGYPRHDAKQRRLVLDLDLAQEAESLPRGWRLGVAWHLHPGVITFSVREQDGNDASLGVHGVVDNDSRVGRRHQRQVVGTAPVVVLRVVVADDAVSAFDGHAGGAVHEDLVAVTGHGGVGDRLDRQVVEGGKANSGRAPLVDLHLVRRRGDRLWVGAAPKVVEFASHHAVGQLQERQDGDRCGEDDANNPSHVRFLAFRKLA
jgi:hypothetical protein